MKHDMQISVLVDGIPIRSVLLFTIEARDH